MEPANRASEGTGQPGDRVQKIADIIWSVFGSFRFTLGKSKTFPKILHTRSSYSTCIPIGGV